MPSSKGLYKRGNTWWIRYAGSDGKIRFESSKTTRKREAESLLIQRKQEVLKGEDVKIGKVSAITLAEFAPQYISWAKRQKGFKEKKNVTLMLVRVWGNLQMKKFNSQMLEQYQTDLLNEDFAPATINRRLATIKHMFSKALEWEMVSEIVREKVRRVKLLPENNRRLRYLSKEESDNLVTACDPHLKPIVIAALNTGMRKSEIFSLEWEKNIDMKHGFILLDTSKNNTRREIPINQPLRHALQGINRRLDVPYLFFNPSSGKKLVDIRFSFRKALKKAGIKDFNFHDLRHTFASQLVMKGVDITTLKELLGHKSLTMTLRYAHLALSHKVNAVKKLEEPFNKKSKENINYTKTIQS